MKRLFSLLLCAVLIGGLSLPALATDDAATDRLTRVTQAVKDTLDLDTSEYESFQGDCYEQELTNVWSLYWSGTPGTLSVEALEDGTVISYRLSDDSISPASTSSLPSFPGGDEEALTEAAQAFLDKVLDPALESVQLDEPSGLDQLGGDSCRFSGVILLNGLPSPLTYSLTLRISDGTVTRFWRDVPETVCLGDVPPANQAVTESQAAEALKDTLSLRLEYVLPEEDSTTAVLRYLPDPIHDFYVDAVTGELVDLTELQEKMYTFGGGDSGAASEDAAPESSASPEAGNLTEAEQAGIAKLDGVLSTDALDATLRDVAAYGLDQYTLTSAQYQLVEGANGEEDQIRCILRYSRSAEDGTYSRTFTVDARTVELITLRSSAPWNEDRTAALDHDQALARAEAFLEEHYGDHFTHLDLYDFSDAEDGSAFYSFTFTRKENGYFYADNFYRVGIDAADGSVSALSFQYDEALSFDTPDGILTTEQALDAWMATYETTLSYLLVPQELDESDPTAQKLMGMGLDYFYVLKLGYTLEREDYLLGLDAKTGQPVRWEASQSSQLTYDDVEGHWAQDEIQRLAQYGIGYNASSFEPRKTLTQWDLVCLLASVQGYCLDPAQADETERDQAYAIAYSMGALTREEREDARLLTRSEVVRFLLNSAGLGGVARLEGIFTCSYTDRDSIPADELGYAALAQGLGMVQDTYAGTRTATRAEAAVLLARLMENQSI